MLAHKALEPEFICQVFHFCPPNSTFNYDFRWTAILEGIHKTVKQRLKGPRTTSHPFDSHRVPAGSSLTGSHQEPWQRGLNHDTILKVGAQLIGRDRQGVQFKRPRSRSNSNNITILQLADIHLDLFYAEVNLLTIVEKGHVVYNCSHP